MIKKNKHLLISTLSLIVLFLVFILINKTEAQVGDPSSIPIPQQIKEIKQQLDINISPEVPEPNQDVTITVEAYGLDLNSTDMQWLINGKEKVRGLGEKKFTLNVGNSGQSTVTLNITPKDQPLISRVFVFNPSNVDLLWQAETYTPPFYKGKALFSPESSVTMVAIPNFINGTTRTNDSNVVYKWSIDREVQGDYSGYGKNSFQYTSDILSLDTEIEIEAYPSSQQTRKGVGSALLSTKNAFLLFYEDNPTNGVMFNYSLKNQVNLGTRNESKISAFPFNSSSNSKSSGLEYTWYVNSEKIDIPLSTNTITIKKNSAQKIDVASILVSLSNPTHIMQETQNSIDFLFNNN